MAAAAPQRRAAAALALAAWLAPAAVHTQPEGPSTARFYADMGVTAGSEHTEVASIGLLLPVRASGWLARNAGPMSLHGDVSLGAWRASRMEGGHRTFAHLAGLLLWRHAIGGEGSRWFMDLGLGAAVFDRVYAAGTERFSTAFQFTEALGLGHRFGQDGAYEVSLRARHVSNASIKKPNPGANLVLLRLSARF